jgi:GDPmannose 4,6-dehydratase
MFVTSVITDQVYKLQNGQIDKIKIGNINALKDWSHVKDVVGGYLKLALNGSSGDVYNQGSMQTNSVLTYILLSLEASGYTINSIETFNSEKKVLTPTLMDENSVFGVKFEKTLVDLMILEDNLEYKIEDKGINVNTDKGNIQIEFDTERFRQSEVPINLSDTTKIQNIGVKNEYKLRDIINDQLNYLKQIIK